MCALAARVFVCSDHEQGAMISTRCPHVAVTETRCCVTQAMLQWLGIKTMLNELSSTVVFERPTSEAFVRKWQLACQGAIAHVVVMPNITIAKMLEFVEDLILQRRGCTDEAAKRAAEAALNFAEEHVHALE